MDKKLVRFVIWTIIQPCLYAWLKNKNIFFFRSGSKGNEKGKFKSKLHHNAQSTAIWSLDLRFDGLCALWKKKNSKCVSYVQNLCRQPSSLHQNVWETISFHFEPKIAMKILRWKGQFLLFIWTIFICQILARLLNMITRTNFMWIVSPLPHSIIRTLLPPTETENNLNVVIDKSHQ